MGQADNGTSLPGIEELQLVGGRLSLDFVNTSNWIDDVAVDDRLDNDNALSCWAAHVGMRPTIEEPEDDVDFASIVDTRFAIRRLLEDNGYSSTSEIEDRIAHHRTASPTSSNFVLLAVLFSALEVATSIRGAVKTCPGPRCGWLFVDESPSGRRRWCSMATCGNRSKSNQHHKRRTSAPADI